MHFRFENDSYMNTWGLFRKKQFTEKSKKKRNLKIGGCVHVAWCFHLLIAIPFDIVPSQVDVPLNCVSVWAFDNTQNTIKFSIASQPSTNANVAKRNSVKIVSAGQEIARGRRLTFPYTSWDPSLFL